MSLLFQDTPNEWFLVTGSRFNADSVVRTESYPEGVRASVFNGTPLWNNRGVMVVACFILIPDPLVALADNRLFELVTKESNNFGRLIELIFYTHVDRVYGDRVEGCVVVRKPQEDYIDCVYDIVRRHNHLFPRIGLIV